jgi:hypothetical protein
MPVLQEMRDIALSDNVEAVYAGADWISCSLPVEADSFWEWVNYCRVIVEEIAKEGEKLEARSLNGYRGLAAGGSFYGVRGDGAYFQLSSHRADRYLSGLYRAALHISRLDVQVTVRYRVMPENMGPALRKSASDANAALAKSRQRRIWCMEGNDGGYTLYIGSPSSDQRCRIYNKAVQSEDPAYVRCWRYEVVFRNQYATAITEQLLLAGEDRARHCGHIVAEWLLLRGIAPPWNPLLHGHPLPLFNEVPSTAEKKLTWLKDQVQPALRWLVENGHIISASKALGYEMDMVDEEGGPEAYTWRWNDA